MRLIKNVEFVMSVLNDFPNPWTADITDDIIAVGGHLDGTNLALSYQLGIFPWPHKGYPLLWFCPDQRGVLDFSELHISHSLKKWIRKNEGQITVTINQAFSDVMRECQQQVRPGQKGSWINSAMKKAYQELFVLGHIISIECWENGELISGIYGVRSKNYFSCESMFFKKSNASKFAFIQLIKVLQKQGLSWMDLQMVTDVCQSFGGKYISRKEFLKRIR